MRRLLELSLLAAACGGLAFVLHVYTDSRPTLISGLVVDANSGRPVPGVAVWWQKLNTSDVLTETDAEERFSTVVEPREFIFSMQKTVALVLCSNRNSGS